MSNENVIKAIEVDLNTRLNKTLEVIKAIKVRADEDIKKINSKQLLEGLEVTIINICNRVKPSQLIQKTQDEIIAHYLYISYLLDDLSPKYNKELFLANQKMLEKLDLIEDYDNTDKFKYLGFSNDSKSSGSNLQSEDKPILEVKKRKNHWIYVVLVICFMLLRVCSKA